MRALSPAALAVTLASVLLVACGDSGPDPTPVACLEGKESYLAATEGAPGAAGFPDGTAIRDCLVPDQSVGDLNTIGSATVAAATELNTAAQKDPGGEEAAQLGWLVGSLEEGASGTGGIHTDLIRRINSAARFSEDPDGLPAEFEQVFGESYAAAREAGSGG